MDVAVVSRFHPPIKAAVTKVVTRKGAIVSVYVGATSYGSDGRHRTGGAMYDHLEPWSAQHDTAVRRAYLIAIITQQERKWAMQVVPTEALEAFAAALEAVGKETRR